MGVGGPKSKTRGLSVNLKAAPFAGNGVIQSLLGRLPKVDRPHRLLAWRLICQTVVVEHVIPTEPECFRRRPSAWDGRYPVLCSSWRPLSLALQVLAVSGLLGLAGPAAADQYDQARAAHPELFKVYYQEGVLEYCGLLTKESALGFVLERDALLSAMPISEAAHHDVRVAGSIAADLQYDNHGLGGQKLWCGTEGMDAYNRFVDRYRAQSINGGSAAGGSKLDPMAP